jgi:hypothetical protein
VILQNGVSGITLVGTGFKTAGPSATVSANGASTQRCAMNRNAFVAIFDAARARGVSSRAESGKGEAREFGAIAPVARSRVRDGPRSVEWETWSQGLRSACSRCFSPAQRKLLCTHRLTHPPPSSRTIFVKGSNVVLDYLAYDTSCIFSIRFRGGNCIEFRTKLTARIFQQIHLFHRLNDTPMLQC